MTSHTFNLRVRNLMLTAALSCAMPVLSGCATLVPTEKPEGIPNIDSSNWSVDPSSLGMSAEQYIQGESRAFFATFIERSGLNNFYHFQGLSKAEDKWVVSPNNDTIYSVVIINVRDGFKLELPEVGERFLAVHILDENHISPFYFYGGGNRDFTADQFATDYIVLGVRTGTDGSEEDVKYVIEELHPKYKIVGANPQDDMIRPDVDMVTKVRDALIPQYDQLPNTFGTMQSNANDVTDWEKFTYVTAGAWGLSKEENAMYLPYAKADVKGGDCYRATYAKVPAKEFFSITAYGPDKYLMSNENNIVSTTRGLKSNPDGSFSVAFGDFDCKDYAPNFLYTPKDGWSFLMRAYRPDVDAFRSYQVPEIVAVE